MTEQAEALYDWDTIDVDENITESDQVQSDNIDIQTPVGKFLVTVMEATPIEKTFKNYNCMAAKLKMRIDDILEIEQPVIDSKGQQVKRDGEIVQKVQPITSDKAEGIKALYTGRFIFDEINLYNPKEKTAMKNRRLFIAKKLGLITSRSTNLTTAMWARIPGHRVIITTEWNCWKDKMTDELKKNVRVSWSGYDSPVNTRTESADIAGGENTEDFSNI